MCSVIGQQHSTCKFCPLVTESRLISVKASQHDSSVPGIYELEGVVIKPLRSEVIMGKTMTSWRFHGSLPVRFCFSTETKQSRSCSDTNLQSPQQIMLRGDRSTARHACLRAHEGYCCSRTCWSLSAARKMGCVNMKSSRSVSAQRHKHTEIICTDCP